MSEQFEATASADAAGHAIRFGNVCKSYSERRVLDDFCLEVGQGEFMTVIGSSGSGKTTMLKMINGLHRPDSGSVHVWGEDVFKTDLIRLRRRIGYVIQGIGLFPHLDVRGNISYVPKLEGRVDRKKLNARVNRLMELVGLEPEMAERYPSELSGGQRQRVGIARALAGSPELMLMDEPFSAVDELTREMLQDEIVRIQRELGLTIMFVTHDIRESCKLGSRVLVMREGRKIQLGTPEDILQNPADDFVHQLTRQVENCN